MKYYSPMNKPFEIYGLPFVYTDNVYRRLPVNPPYPLPDAVERLAWQPSGGQVHFRAKLKQLAVKAKMAAPCAMANMCPMGQSGIDCYLRDIENEDILRYNSTACPKNPTKETITDSVLLTSDTVRTYDIVLNLPLYMRMDELEIGFDDEAEVYPPEVRPNPRRVIFYGGSITQGGCASRPGLSYTNILSRWTGHEFINYGFNGAGKAEDAVAEAIVKTDGAALFVINTMGNCPDGDYIREHYPRFISILRRKYPETPILLWTFGSWAQLRYNEAIKAKFEKMIVDTGVPARDKMVNGFLKAQTLFSRFYARFGPYQPGGAFGMRDQ
nr:hypothetical protein [Clostridia bacterium]